MVTGTFLKKPYMAVSYQIKSLNQYYKDYKRSVNDPEAFWGDIASHFYWRKPWEKVLEWNFKEPEIKWFQGGKLNITENCLDRHIANLGDSPAIIWEPNDPNELPRTLTYSELLFKVKQFAHVLKNNGIKKGDRGLCLYGNGSRTGYCRARLCKDRRHSFSSIWWFQRTESIADRLQDAQAKLVIT